MPGENEDLNPTSTEQVEEVVDETGFDAGFAGTEDQTKTPVFESVDADPEPKTEDAPKFVQITEEQWNDMQAKANEATQKFDKVFGQLGGMKQVIERAQSRTDAGQPVEITSDDVAEMREEFPELADLTLKALQKAAAKFKGTGGVDPAITERLAKTQSELIDSRLDEVVDGDWKEEVSTTQFSEWLKKQPQDTQALSTSSSVRDAAKMLRLYRAAKNAPPPPAPPPAAVSSRARQLAAAVNPRSAGAKPSVTTAEDEFDAGFNSR